MKKNIDIVFFGDYRHIVWNEEINEKLQILFQPLGMAIGKSIETEITGDTLGVQNVKTIERPVFFNEGEELNFGIMTNRIDFRFSIKGEFIEKLRNYFYTLNEISKELDVEINRVGINIGMESIKRYPDLLSDIPILKTEAASEFGIKKNIIKRIDEINTDTNLLFIIESNFEQTVIFLDNNTIQKENNIINSEMRIIFLEEAIKNFQILENEINNIIGE